VLNDPQNNRIVHINVNGVLLQFASASAGDVQTQSSGECTDGSRSKASPGQVSRAAQGGTGGRLRENKHTSAAEL